MTGWQSKCVVHKSYKSDVYVSTSHIDKLEPSQVLVKTEFASINPVDIKVHALSFRSKEWHTLRDFSGVVEAVGSEAKGKFSVGEHVYGSIPMPSDSNFIGSYTLTDINKYVLAPKPPALSPKEAAALPIAYNTGFQMLQRANNSRKLDASSRVLILGGATSVGTFAVQLAKKHFGAGHVVATCSPSSEGYVRGFGADQIINYRVPDVRQEFVKFVTQQGQKFDTILDCVGGYDAIAVFPQILKPASEGSTYISIMGDAGPAKTYAGTMVNALLNIPRSAFRYFFGKYYGINYTIFFTSKDRASIDAAPAFFATPGVKVPIDSVYPVEDIKAAWEKVDSTRARGKVIIQF